MVMVNKSGLSHAKRLIRQGKINRSDAWSFSAEDGNKLLGDNQWNTYEKFHLALDNDENENTKGHYKYPYGKGGLVYRRGVLAAKARAAAENASDIVNATDELINMIDKEEKSKIRELLEKALNYLSPQETKEVQPKQSGFVVEKGLDDTWRWFAWVTNKWVDRQGQIITDSAHKEFIQYLDQNPHAAPELWTWHTPGTEKTNRADWWDYANGFVVFSGPLTETEAEQYKDLSDDIGMSHGFYVLQYDFEHRHIMKYRTFEVSELPRDMAANPYTFFETIQEENTKMFDSKRRQYLVERYGEEKVTQLEGDTESREKALLELGVNMKQLESDWEEQYEKALSERIAKASEVNANKMVKEVVTQLTEALNMDELQKTILNIFDEIETLKAATAKVTTLESEIEHLKATEDERIAATITPTQPFQWGRSATQSKDNIVTEDELTEEVKKQVNSAVKSNGWMSALRPGGVA